MNKLPKIFGECVTDIFHFYFGSEASKSLFSYLESIWGIEKGDMLEELESFQKGLDKVLGTATPYVLDEISKEFASKTKIKYSSTLTFYQNINRALSRWQISNVGPGKRKPKINLRM